MAQDGTRILQIGELTLDPAAGTLRRGGDLIPVRAKTFRLLAHLAASPGRVVGKDELMAAVWPEVTVTEDSLVQAVRDLRRVIGDDRGSVLRTVARRGYLLDPGAAPAPEPMPAPAGPRVAILPFATQSDDPADPPLIDGIVEEITHGLARFGTIAVIARHSAFAFPARDRPAAPEVGAALGASHLVEGTARRSGARFQLSLALIEAADGRTLWGERLDLAATDMLTLQDILPRRIIARLVANLEASVLARATAGPAASPSAFEHLTRGIALLRSYGPGANEGARDACRRALAIDPDYGLAHAYLALAELLIGGYGAAPRPQLEASRDRALRATALAPEESRCHRILALIQMFMRDYAASEDSFRRARDLNPYDADTLAQTGYLLAIRGRAAEGLDWLDRAVALNPLHPPWYHFDRAKALYALGRFAEAAAALTCLPRRQAWHETFLAAALAMAGRPAEAARHLAAAEAISPGWQPLTEARAADWEHPEDMERLHAGIRAAMAAR
jgi:TolB-like protein/Tfp pilus assembly protein PilF